MGSGGICYRAEELDLEERRESEDMHLAYLFPWHTENSFLKC